MKREMDLVRNILLAVEKQDDGSVTNKHFDFGDVEEDVLQEHLFLLYEAGFLEGSAWKGLSGREFSPNRLTWSGHEFLDAVRDPEIWAKTKDGAKRAGGFSLELVGELAKGLIKQKIKQHTGVEF